MDARFATGRLTPGRHLPVPDVPSAILFDERPSPPFVYAYQHYIDDLRSITEDIDAAVPSFVAAAPV